MHPPCPPLPSTYRNLHLLLQHWARLSSRRHRRPLLCSHLQVGCLFLLFVFLLRSLSSGLYGPPYSQMTCLVCVLLLATVAGMKAHVHATEVCVCVYIYIYIYNIYIYIHTWFLFLISNLLEPSRGCYCIVTRNQKRFVHVQGACESSQVLPRL